MAYTELEIWWASLPVREKERIACKSLTKAGIQDESLWHYPACTRWWEDLAEDRKVWIKQHCESAHGDVVREWDDANPYGD